MVDAHKQVAISICKELNDLYRSFETKSFYLPCTQANNYESCGICNGFLLGAFQLKFDWNMFAKTPRGLGIGSKDDSFVYHALLKDLVRSIKNLSEYMTKVLKRDDFLDGNHVKCGQTFANLSIRAEELYKGIMPLDLETLSKNGHESGQAAAEVKWENVVPGVR